MKKFIGFLVILLSVYFIVGCSTRASAIELGQKAPDFNLKDLNGNPVNINSLTKNGTIPAVLVFFATWCPPCRAEVPHVEKFFNEYNNKVSVLGINVGETKIKVMGFKEKMGISYPIALSVGSSVERLYEVIGIPTVVAISKTGQIIYYGHSVEEAKKALRF